MLKISRREGTTHRLTLEVEGFLGGRWVEEVRQACRAALAERGRVVLDLSGVIYVDRAGTELLKNLSAESGIELGALSPFVAELLRGGVA